MNTGANSPSAGRARRNPLVRLLASVRFGITMLFLLLLYASLASALPQIRGALEMTEMEIFRHWLFVVLVVLFSASLVTATVTRIRWNLINAGVLTVHSGLLLLVGGSVWYFGTKIEGDVLLRSPRVELISRSSSNARVIAELPAEPGRSWSRFMPTLGGNAHVSVLEVGSNASQPVASVTVSAHLGQGEPQTITVSAGQSAPTPINDRLGLRLRIPPPERAFFDDEATALYYRKVSEPRRKMAEIHGLPFFRERYLDEGYVLHDGDGREVPSKRATPHVALAGLKIPTGWFEQWRLPIKIAAPELPFDVEITGYLPYVSGGRVRLSAGGEAENPALDFTLTLGSQSFNEALFALAPAHSFSARLPVEFRWAATPQERDELLRPLAGAHELYIEVLDPPVKKTVAISPGRKIQVEGTPYELTVERLARSWEMKSPGFEGARSPIVQVSVTNGEKSYQRTVVERFPQLTQDVDEQGVRHREGPYDPNLILRYRNSANGLLLVVAGPELEPVLGIFDTDGTVLRFPLSVGQPQEFGTVGQTMAFTLNSLHRKARQVFVPTVVPLEVRRPRMDRQLSAIRMKLTGRGENAGWSETHWCFFSAYPHIDPRSIVVRPPGDATSYELVYSRLKHDLGATLVPRSLSVELFPGGRSVESWRSDFWVRGDDGTTAPGAVYTNQTHSTGRWALFQSGAATDHWSYTILGVGNRNGIWPMNIGWMLVTVGCLYAFYVKPILRRRRQRRAMQRDRMDDPVETPTSPKVDQSEQPEVMEVRS